MTALLNVPQPVYLPVLPVQPLHFKFLPSGCNRSQLSRSISRASDLLRFTRSSESLQPRRLEASIFVGGVCSGWTWVSGWSGKSERSRRSKCCWSCSRSFHPGQVERERRDEMRNTETTDVVYSTGWMKLNILLSVCLFVGLSARLNKNC